MDKLGHAALNPPEMDRVSSIVLFVFSILLPGVTQFVFGLFYGCDWPYMVVGVLMFILSPFMLGWFWSIAWGARAIWNGEVVKQAAAAPEEPGEVTA